MSREPSGCRPHDGVGYSLGARRKRIARDLHLRLPDGIPVTFELPVVGVLAERKSIESRACTSIEDGLAAWIDLEHRGFNVYAGACLVPAGTVKGGARGLAQDAAVVGFAAQDLDVRGAGHSSDEMLPTIDEVFAAYEWLPQKPSYLLWTGGGFLAVWLLDALLEFDADDATPGPHVWTRERWSRVAVGLENAWRLALSIVSGGSKHVDSTADLARIVRVAGGLNTKPGYRIAGRLELGVPEVTAVGKTRTLLPPSVRYVDPRTQEWSYETPDDPTRFAPSDLEELADCLEQELEKSEHGCVPRVARSMRWTGLPALLPLTPGFLDRVPLQLDLPTVKERGRDAEKLAQMGELLRWIPANAYAAWIQVGAAISHESGASAEGLALWDAWSEQAEPGGTYERGACAKKWPTFPRSDGPRASIRTILRLSERAGYRIPHAHDDLRPPTVKAKSKAEAIRSVQEIAAAWVPGAQSLALSGDPGLAKTTALLDAGISGLADGWVDTQILVISLPTRALIAEKAGQAVRILREAGIKNVTVEIYHGREACEDHAFERALAEHGVGHLGPGLCTETGRVRDARTIHAKACSGCLDAPACSSKTSGARRWLRETERLRERAGEARNGGPRLLVFCTHASLEGLVALIGTAGTALMIDDPGDASAAACLARSIDIHRGEWMDARDRALDHAFDTSSEDGRRRRRDAIRRQLAWQEHVASGVWKRARKQFLDGELDREAIERWIQESRIREHLEFDKYALSEMANKIGNLLDEPENPACRRKAAIKLLGSLDGTMLPRLLASIVADGARALLELRRERREPVLGWLQDVFGDEGSLVTPFLRAECDPFSGEPSWPWEAPDPARGGIGANVRGVLEDVVQAVQRGAAVYAERAPGHKSLPASKAGITLHLSAMNVQDLARSGRVVWSSVGQIPTDLLDHVGARYEHVELETPLLDIAVARLEYQGSSSMRVERFNSGRKGNGSGLFEARQWIRALHDALRVPGGSVTIAGHTVQDFRVVCSKDFADALIHGEPGLNGSSKIEGQPDLEPRLLRYGSEHAATNKAEGVELLIVIAHRRPPQTAHEAAEITRRVLGMPWPGEPEELRDEPILVRWKAALERGIDLRGPTMRRRGHGPGTEVADHLGMFEVRDAAWRLPGWQPVLRSVSTDLLVRACALFNEAQWGANACGRSRPPDDHEQERLVILLDGYAVPGVRPSRTVEFRELARAIGAPEPNWVPAQVRGINQANRARRESGAGERVRALVVARFERTGQVLALKDLVSEDPELGKVSRKTLSAHLSACIQELHPEELLQSSDARSIAAAIQLGVAYSKGIPIPSRAEVIAAASDEERARMRVSDRSARGWFRQHTEALRAGIVPVARSAAERIALRWTLHVLIRLLEERGRLGLPLQLRLPDGLLGSDDAARPHLARCNPPCPKIYGHGRLHLATSGRPLREVLRAELTVSERAALGPERTASRTLTAYLDAFEGGVAQVSSKSGQARRYAVLAAVHARLTAAETSVSEVIDGVGADAQSVPVATASDVGARGRVAAELDGPEACGQAALDQHVVHRIGRAPVGIRRQALAAVRAAELGFPRELRRSRRPALRSRPARRSGELVATAVGALPAGAGQRPTSEADCGDRLESQTTAQPSWGPCVLVGFDQPPRDLVASPAWSGIPRWVATYPPTVIRSVVFPDGGDPSRRMAGPLDNTEALHCVSRGGDDPEPVPAITPRRSEEACPRLGRALSSKRPLATSGPNEEPEAERRGA